jgi:Putative MetA-pathway of phenol degradation
MITKFRALVLLSLGVVVTTIPLAAQTCSPTAFTNALICTLPQLFGTNGLVLPNPNHAAHFVLGQKTAFLPINISIGEELSTLPLGSSGSATTFTLDSAGHPVPVLDSLGPILTERANVIGKGVYQVGVAYQYFSFNKLDGVNLHSFPILFDHVDSAGVPPTSFRNDYVQTTNHAYLALNQTVIYGIVGISHHLDATIEVPIDSVHFRVSSDAQIVRTQPCEYQQAANGGGSCTGPVLDPEKASLCGLFHFFYYDGTNCSSAFNSVTASFPSLVRPDNPPSTDATGIGDIILQGKYEVIRGEKWTGSIGMGLRLPTGDEKNFLGSGAVGLTPFGALTYRARLSPHVRIGYQWNGDSDLGGDPTGTTGLPSSASLPPEFLYSGGADFRVNKRLTLDADLIGEVVLSASHLSLGSEMHYMGDSGTQTAVPTVKSSTDTYSSDAIGVGGKVRIWKEAVLVGNVSFKVDNGGLRATAVPLVGLTYAF